MNILKWFFSFRETYRRDQIKYAKLSTGSKIVQLVLQAIFTVLTLVLVWFTIKSFGDNVGVAILLTILSVAAVLSMAKLNSMYCLIAINNIINKKLQGKVVDAINNVTPVTNITDGDVVSTPIMSVSDKNLQVNYTENSKTMDILGAIFYGVMSLAVVVVSIIMVFNAMQAGLATL